MLKRLALFACILLGIGTLLAADPVEGFWKSIDEKTGEVTAYWKIYQDNGLLFGQIVKVPGKADDAIAEKAKATYKNFPVAGVVNKMKYLGTPWIYNLKMKKEGQWEGGTIVDPGKGDAYSCKITFRAMDGKKYKTDVLEMRGEIGLGLGRSQFWQRASEADFK